MLYTVAEDTPSDSLARLWLHLSLSCYYTLDSSKLENACQYHPSAAKLLDVIFDAATPFKPEYFESARKGALVFISRNASEFSSVVLDDLFDLNPDEFTHVPQLETLSCYVDHVETRSEECVLADDTKGIRSILGCSHPAYWKIAVACYSGDDEWCLSSDLGLKTTGIDFHVYGNTIDRLLRLQIAARVSSNSSLDRACLLTLACLNEECDKELSPVEVNRIFLSCVRQCVETELPLHIGRKIRAGIYEFLHTQRSKSLVSPHETLVALKRGAITRAMARQNLYFFVVSAFDAPPATLTRSVANVNDTDIGSVNDELVIVGVMAGQVTTASSSDRLAISCKLFYESTIMQTGCEARVRPFLCSLVTSSLSDDVTRPLDDVKGKWSANIPLCMSVFLGGQVDQKQRLRDEVCTLAAVLAYEKDWDLFSRIDSMIDEAWPLLSANQQKLVKVSMLGYTIDVHGKSPRLYIFDQPDNTPVAFLWRYEVSSRSLERLMEDLLAHKDLSDELTCVLAITTECIRQAGPGIPKHVLDTVFHTSSKRYLVSVEPDDPLFSVSFAKVRIAMAALEVLKRPELILELKFDNLPRSDSIASVVALAKDMRQAVIENVEKKAKTKKERRRERRLLQRSVSIQVDRAKRDCEELDANEPEKLAVEEEPLVEHAQVEEDVTQVECSETTPPDETNIKASDWSLAGRRREQRVHKAFRWCAFQDDCSRENCLFYHENRECDLLVPPPLCNRGIQCHGYRCHFLHLSRENYVRVCQMSKDDAMEYSESFDIARAVRESQQQQQLEARFEDDHEAVQIALSESRKQTQPPAPVVQGAEDDAVQLACRLSEAEMKIETTFDSKWEMLQRELAEEDTTSDDKAPWITQSVTHHTSECAVCFEDVPRCVLSCGCARVCVSCARGVVSRSEACPVCRQCGVTVLLERVYV
jgi:hypothetical protein